MDVDDQAKLLDALPDAVVLLDASATLCWGNQAAVRTFGWSLEDVKGRSALELVHPDDHHWAARALTSVQDKSVGSLIEVRIRAAEGWRLSEIIGAPYGDGGVLISIRDITERRRYEIANGDDSQMRATMHHSGVVTLLMRADRTVTSVSGAMTRITGLDPESVEDEPISNLVPDPADQLRLEAAVDDSRVGDPSTVVVGVRTFGHDPVLPMELTIVNLLDDPTVGCYVVSAHDVSERVAVERELRSALSLLSATLDSTADGILVVDGENNITSFNQQFIDMWRIPLTITETRDDRAALGFVMDQLAYPDVFVAKVEELYAEPDAESYDMLEFKDGRVFERFSRPQRVDGAVVGRVWSFRDLTERKRLEDELVYRAFHDQLTGLPNKARFCDRLAHAADRSRRTTANYAVLFCDLDNFKTVNDSLGHHSGDELIRVAADSISSCLRAGDTAARLGGDEFAILVEDLTEPDDATALAERIVGAFRQPFRLGHTEVMSTVSIGVAFGAAGSTSEQLLRNADLAMYLAKGRGKNRYECYRSEAHDAVVVRIEVEADLHHALERDELTLFYQPIVETGSEAIVAAEALVRWEHPTRGLLLPATFIPLAEEAGLMDAIGARVLHDACRTAAGWNRPGRPPVAVSVNVSSRQLAGEAIVPAVVLALTESGLDPSNLILEITETAMFQDTQTARRNLRALKAMGLRLALDDFGTGYSSLTHLQHFPIDIVKIDKSFVASIVDRDSVLAPAIIQLASSLGLTTVAEGVENAEQLRRLRELDCDLLQGFWLHRPMTETRVTDLILDHEQVLGMAAG